MRWLWNWWHARQRAIDVQMLWPLCKANAIDIDHARAAFGWHAHHDEAWLCLGEDEIAKRIDVMR